jgi:dTDP-glucose 4,6-dehydratase
MCKDWEQTVKYVKDRPGHDRRYAIDATKIKQELGWHPKWTFEKGIAATIDWYRTNEKWWRDIKTGEYLKYYERQYQNRGH